MDTGRMLAAKIKDIEKKRVVYENCNRYLPRRLLRGIYEKYGRNKENLYYRS